MGAACLRPIAASVCCRTPRLPNDGAGARVRAAASQPARATAAQAAFACVRIAKDVRGTCSAEGEPKAGSRLARRPAAVDRNAKAEHKRHRRTDAGCSQCAARCPSPAPALEPVRWRRRKVHSTAATSRLGPREPLNSPPNGTAFLAQRRAVPAHRVLPESAATTFHRAVDRLPVPRRLGSLPSVRWKTDRSGVDTHTASS
jgi:hypothetical protein